MAPFTDNVHELDRTDVEANYMPGGVAYDRFFTCPLDYNNPQKKSIQVFVRHLVSSVSVDKHKSPFALYLQGGPGFQSPYQTNLSSGWVGVLLSQGYQVLLLDQRGTGLSTPINAQSQVLKLPTLEEQVEYMKCFRADSIVKDCEIIRKILTQGRSPNDSKLTLLSQSFGGFCATTYLSFYPEGVDKVVITGGLPPLVKDPVDVYSSLIPRMALLNERYYSLYKRDIERVYQIAEYLTNNKVVLPGGGIMTLRRFQQFGLAFGGGGGFSSVHKIVLDCCYDLDTIQRFSYKTLLELESFNGFETNVIYTILHEPIYCEEGVASNWACERAIQQNSSYKSQLNFEEVKLTGSPLFFTGEMIFSWMAEDYPEIGKFKELFFALAEHDKWSKLYDRDALRRNTVPVSAVCYYDDPYVALNLSQECASTINGSKIWITNEYLHNGLHVDNQVITKLLNMLSK
ncbi:hypothetical protein BB560_006584 [Smittium megazygosporum]|uniref:AB hydrolase-1 domain-containing protein n=1 Tax=Smittium megazygosporum TaxID=133381 RepID=A0A2T9Y3I8_9FUNG|nr:hypothetical protein BB560_006584 [Smittium megazygosporum]